MVTICGIVKLGYAAFFSASGKAPPDGKGGWQAVCGLLMEKAAKEWERIGTEEMCREFKSKIREEMRRKEQYGGEF